jgi:hypothetical protein
MSDINVDFLSEVISLQMWLLQLGITTSSTSPFVQILSRNVATGLYVLYVAGNSESFGKLWTRGLGTIRHDSTSALRLDNGYWTQEQDGGVRDREGTHEIKY